MSKRRERWKPVVGFEGLYEVSDRGRVKSLVRPHVLKVRILKPTPDKDGYQTFILLMQNKKRFCKKVHRMVLESFVGLCPEGMQCRHLDDDKTNNKLSNLKWGTPKQDRADMVANGNATLGERSASAKLTRKDILIIRSSKKMQKELAAIFGVGQGQISRIKLHQRWGHV